MIICWRWSLFDGRTLPSANDIDSNTSIYAFRPWRWWNRISWRKGKIVTLYTSRNHSSNKEISVYSEYCFSNDIYWMKRVIAWMYQLTMHRYLVFNHLSILWYRVTRRNRTTLSIRKTEILSPKRILEKILNVKLLVASAANGEEHNLLYRNLCKNGAQITISKLFVAPIVSYLRV